MKHTILTPKTSKEDLFRKYSNPLLDRAYKKAKGLLVEEDGVPPEEDKPKGGEGEEGKLELPTVLSLDDFLKLENVKCYDHNNNITEEYSVLYVAKDVVRQTSGNDYQSFTPYQAITHFEQNKLFLPSFALACAIVNTLYQNKRDSEVKKVLDQYKDYGSGHGWHAQNTVVDWKARQIKHYPYDKDFPEYGGSDNINGSKKIVLPFDASNFGDFTLVEALKKPNFREYLIDLTGLQNPEKLLDIAKYFSRTAQVWVPDNPKDCKDTQAGWFGCNGNFLGLDTSGNLGGSVGARGVQLFPR